MARAVRAFAQGPRLLLSTSPPLLLPRPPSRSGRSAYSPLPYFLPSMMTWRGLVVGVGPGRGMDGGCSEGVDARGPTSARFQWRSSCLATRGTQARQPAWLSATCTRRTTAGAAK